MEMDGIGNAEVYGGLERHGLDEREGAVPELELRNKQALVRAVIGGELHHTLMILLLSLCGGWTKRATLCLFI
jgi:hypothetical protein